MADQKYYEVEKLLDKKVEGKRTFFLVRWKTFSPEYDTWEPARNLTACQPMFKQFDKAKKASKSMSVAAKLLKGSKMSQSKGASSKTSKGHDKKSSQIIANARQKIAAELKSKTKKLAKQGAVLNTKKAEPKDKGVKKSGSKSESPARSVKSSTSPPKSAKKTSPSSKKVKETISKTVKHTGSKRGPETPKSTNTEHSSKKKKKEDSSRTPGTGDAVTKKKTPKESSKSISKGKKDAFSKSDSGKHSAKASGDKHTVANKKASTKGGKSSHKRKNNDPSKAEAKSKASGKKTPDLDFSIISDSESDDDDLLYSLVNGVDDKGDGHKSQGQTVKNRNSDAAKQAASKGSPKKNSQSSSHSPSKSSNSRRMSLIDFKKPKPTPKSGQFEQLLRPSSPTPFFTPLKAVQSPLRGSLPMTTPLGMDSLVGDVPTFQAAPAGPLSPSSISYRTLLDNLPSQLHPKQKGGKKKENGYGASTSSGSSGQSTLSSAFDTAEPIERRISVRATECVFRYKQIVVKKCHRYTQIWLNTQTMLKNAFNPQVVQEVVAALNTAKYDDSSLVLFSSIGSFFCSGIDLHFLTTGDRRVAARQMADALRELTKAFITFPKPVIAGVGGSAVGLGVALLCLCDVVYSSDKAAFHLPYAQLSQTPEACSSFTLPMALGLASANELLFGGRRITAMEAYQLGLVSHVFWPTAFMQEVIPRAQNMASCSAKVLEGTKLLIRSHLRTKMELTNETECNLLLERWSSNECQRAMEAYLANENNFSS
ncbi:testis-specific chromodomain protein Y 2-like [Littorina saxatilis]|uniref:Chromo domain-containing protein n=1 Tax=Littorina saxatilis TaxID=31220 RepID=A0AAN9C6N8_9CAEN